MAVGSLVVESESRSARPATLARAIELLGVAVQLALALLVIREFRIESQTFYQMVLLAVGGSVVNALLPMRLRLSWFVLLSLAGIGLAFGSGGLWLVGAGLLLIGLCHLPLRWSLRVLLLLLAGGGLALVRAGRVSSPLPLSIWPILGSMFMFRLIVYMHSLRFEPRKSWAHTLAYFFMLPNVCFPLFPVVDYKTFLRTYYDGDALATYQRGLKWIARGLLHLILYRLVYHYLANDPTTLTTLGGLLQYLVSAYLLYLRVSGQFHVIVGLLHLFGFNLPETHHLYFFATGFADLWRRINIYWKDFIMKLVYYPSFFRFRRLGNSAAMLLGTFVVFALTWFFHSYQWFWLRGSFPVTAQDALFWAAIGLLLALAMLREARKPKRRLGAVSGWSLTRGLAAFGTFATMCVLWSLWNATSLAEWRSIWSAAAAVEPGLWVKVALLAAAFVVVAGWPWGTRALPREGQPRSWWRPAGMQTMALLSLIYVGGMPRVGEALGPQAVAVLDRLQHSQLNARDERMLTRGYYEALNDVDRFSTELWTARTETPAKGPWTESGAVQRLQDFRWTEMRPDVHLTIYGLPFSTNRWGMRDRDYTRAKPGDTYRLALLGPSDVMGSGVRQEDIFKYRVERRLNADGGGRHYQILNFAVGGYSVLQQIPMLEDRVLQFDPDAVLLAFHPRDQELALEHLYNLVHAGIPIPYPALRDIVDRAGLDSSMDLTTAVRRLRPAQNEIFAWFFSRMGRDCRQAGIPCVLMLLRLPTGTGELDTTAVALARQSGFTVIDMLDVFHGRDDTKLRVAAGDQHPNAEGHRIIADRLYRELRARNDLLHLGLPAQPDSLH